MNNNLILDIGFHKGKYIRYYLYRGFSMPAVDSLVEPCCNLFCKEVESGKFVIKRPAVSLEDKVFSVKNMSSLSRKAKPLVNGGAFYTFTCSFEGQPCAVEASGDVNTGTCQCYLHKPIY